MEMVNARLRERVVDLETLVEALPIGIALSDDPRGRRIVANSHGASIMGMSRRMAAPGEGMPYRFLRDGREVPAEELPLQAVWRSGEPVRNFRATFVHDDGRRFELQMSAAPILDEQGRVVRAIGVYDDISEELRAQSDAERRARQQDYVAALGTRSLRGESFEELLGSVPGEVAEVLSADFVKLLEYRPATNDFLLRASHGFGVPAGTELVVPGGNRSQAGVALESGRAIVVEDLPSDLRFAAPELLEKHGVRSGLSVAIGDIGWPLGVLGVHSRELRSFDEHDVRFAQAVANVLAATIQRDENARHQQVLLAELQHRVKNSLATVQAIASLSFRNAPGAAEELQAFRARIRALSAAHDLLFKTGWRPISLAEIVASQVETLREPGERVRIEAGGPVAMTSNAAMEMGMVLHELGANALRFGALSVEAGSVALSWRLEEAEGDRQLVFEWHESGGPQVSPPVTRGIGTTLVTSAFHGFPGASVTLDYPPEGLSCVMRIPYGRGGPSRPFALD